jgi:hypothetical protein
MCPALGISITTILGTSFQQNATLFGAIRWRRSQATSHGSQTPFLDVCLDEDEAGLTKIDVDDSGTVGTDGWEEIWRLKTVDNLVEFLAVASEKDGAGPWAVSNTDDVALDEMWSIWSRAEWLVVAAGTGRLVRGRVLVIA